MKKIISPYCQHRQNIGSHSNWQNKSYLNQAEQNNLIKKLASRPGLHSNNVQRQELAQGIIQFIALFSALRLCDAPSQYIQDPHIKLKNALPNKVKVNNIPQEIENSGVLVMLKQPIIHLFEKADQIISQYDPFFFPTTEAAPYTKKAKTLSVNFFDKNTTIPIPLSDFNKIEFIYGRFINFRKINNFYPEGKFYDPNIEGPESAINYMRVRYKSKNYIIKENNPGEYYLFNPNLPRTLENEIPVYFKTKDGKVHLGTEIPRYKKRCYDLRKGRCYIKIFGNLYLSNYNWETNRREVILADGYFKNIIDPITQSKINVWQPLTPLFIKLYKDQKFRRPIEKHYGIPTFTNEEENIINKISVNINKNYTYITDLNEAIPYTKKAKTLSVNFFDKNTTIPIPLSDFNKIEFICGRFINFRKINNFYPEGKFYDPNIEGPESAINYMRVRYKSKNYIIKENNPGEYYLFNPNLPRTLENEIPVYFKTKDRKVHLGTEIPRYKKLCYDLRKGRCYIKIFGNLYLSNYNWETNSQEVILADGYFKNITNPITQSKINVWQPLTPLFIKLYKDQKFRRPIEKHYGIPTFTNEEENIINKISVNINKDYTYITKPNEAPNRYGGAKIYFARKINNPFSSSLEQYIKMNKKWVPVYTLIDVREGIYYEIHDDKKVYELQYFDSYTADDGNNWVFKRS